MTERSRHYKRLQLSALVARMDEFIMDGDYPVYTISVWRERRPPKIKINRGHPNDPFGVIEVPWPDILSGSYDYALNQLAFYANLAAL